MATVAQASDAKTIGQDVALSYVDRQFAGTVDLTDERPKRVESGLVLAILAKRLLSDRQPMSALGAIQPLYPALPPA